MQDLDHSSVDNLFNNLRLACIRIELLVNFNVARLKGGRHQAI